MNDDSLAEKERLLKEIVGDLSLVAVAFSGGVDSSLLLAVCADVLGADRVLALTADSPLLPRVELAMARQVASLLGVEHRTLALDELARPEIRANPPDRCYYCKQMRFSALLAMRESAMPDRVLVHGENADDSLDYRPGSRAAAELGVRAPLAEAGLTKAEIRELSRRRGLPTSDMPAEACLATRFPSGTELTAEGLARVERAEVALHRILGQGRLRVRDHFPVARIEIPEQSIEAAVRAPLRQEIVTAVTKAGYRYVAIDLMGYRMGSMNDRVTAR